MISSVFLLLALGTSQLQGQRFKSDGCPEPYGRLDETRCILADPFVDRTYSDAVAFCTDHGGKLLFIENCNDLTLVYDYIQMEAGLASSNYWLAATDVNEEGVWVWEHNKLAVPMGSPFWYVGEPSNAATDDCSIINHSYSYRWTDTSCTGNAKVICLKDG